MYGNLSRLRALLDTDYFNIKYDTIYGLFLNCYRVLWILVKFTFRLCLV